jgi:hypothetical protein
MTKEEYTIALKEAETVLNNLVKEIRQTGYKVDLSVKTDGPGSTVSLLEVKLKY